MKITGKFLVELMNAFEAAGLANKTKRIEQVERYENEDISIMFDHDLQTIFVYDKDQNATVEIQPEELKAMYLYCLSVGWIKTHDPLEEEGDK